MKNGSVAVLDIGSNSIKILVACRSSRGGVEPVFWESLDARISAGISATEPRLSEEGMARGLAAVQRLLALAVPHVPARTRVVATSAVRDARNGLEFRERIRAATGYAVDILSGDEEANGIGRGLASDPALGELRDFHVFDLGGGSLECLTFADRTIRQAVSLQLGCVRLTERFVTDPSGPLSDRSREAIRQHVLATLQANQVKLDPAAIAVGTGGTVTTVRAVLGARTGKSVDQTPPFVSTTQLTEMLDFLGALPLAERKQVPGLTSARADVFPTALATILAVAEAGRFTKFRHSVYNLRYGLAAELLDGI